MKTVCCCLLFLGGILLLLPGQVSAGDSYGDISIRSDPSGALVSLDDSNTTFTTPYRYYAVASGSHTVTITKPGYQVYTSSPMISPGTTTYVYAPLLRFPEYNTLWIHTVPSGAVVSVDGIFKGRTPNGTADNASAYNLIIPDLQNGNHTVLITLEGFANLSKKVITGPDQIGPIVIHEELIPVQPTPAVTLRPDNTSQPLAAARVQATPAPPAGLSLGSDPPGSQILMNGSVEGVTPLTIRTGPGTYVISFVHPGYRPVTVPVEVRPGQYTSRTVSMVPLAKAIQTTLPTIPPTPVRTKAENAGSGSVAISLIGVLSLTGILMGMKR
jgi:hypothetical protein